MAVDVNQEIALILQAIYGKQVRGSLGNGIKKIADEVNKFENDTTKQQNDYETDVNSQWSNYKQDMDADESTRQSNENTRKSNETIRLANEDTRQTVYTGFRDMLNTSQQIGRLPYLFDGGAFGDSGDTNNWVLSMDGGSF